MDKVKRKFDKLSKSQKIIFISGITTILVGPVAGYIIYTKLQESKKTLTPTNLENMYDSSISNASKEQKDRIVLEHGVDAVIITEETFKFKNRGNITTHFNNNNIKTKPLSKTQFYFIYNSEKLSFATVSVLDNDKIRSISIPELNTDKYESIMKRAYLEYKNENENENENENKFRADGSGPATTAASILRAAEASVANPGVDEELLFEEMNRALEEENYSNPEY